MLKSLPAKEIRAARSFQVGVALSDLAGAGGQYVLRMAISLKCMVWANLGGNNVLFVPTGEQGEGGCVVGSGAGIAACWPVQ